MARRNANHPAWQLGHLIAAETGLVSAFDPTAAAKLPDGFDKKFTKETAGKDDPSFFGTKSQLLDQFTKTCGDDRLGQDAQQPADLEKPSPERVRSFAPTLGHLVELIPTHTAMHVGHSRLSKKLGKRLIF